MNELIEKALRPGVDLDIQKRLEALRKCNNRVNNDNNNGAPLPPPSPPTFNNLILPLPPPSPPSFNSFQKNFQVPPPPQLPPALYHYYQLEQWLPKTSQQDILEK